MSLFDIILAQHAYRLASLETLSNADEGVYLKIKEAAKLYELMSSGVQGRYKALVEIILSKRWGLLRMLNEFEGGMNGITEIYNIKGDPYFGMKSTIISHIGT